MNKEIAPSIIIAIALVISAYLLSHSISQLAIATSARKEFSLDSNGRQIEVVLGGRVGFSDSLNPFKVEIQR